MPTVWREEAEGELSANSKPNTGREENPFVQYGLIDNISLQQYRLARRLYLQELLQVEVAKCAVCDLDREILYFGSYDRNINVECFNVCELCGRQLINGSEEVISEIRD